MMDGTGAKSHSPVLSLGNVTRSYRSGDRTLNVLRGVDIELRPGEMTGLVGPSGSGKSTLLHVAGLLEKPDSGTVFIGGKDALKMSDHERTIARRLQLGFVYQFHHLLPEFTALENVAMPLLVRREPLDAVRARAREVLERVGLAERLNHKPGELSGGERQRVAVARALVTEPAVVLADEPTGNLDRKTGDNVLALMLTLNREAGASLVIVTHDARIASRMNRVLRLRDGGLEDATAEYGTDALPGASVATGS
jgi:lipoprotein-releasing system ATP-binding protein